MNLESGPVRLDEAGKLEVHIQSFRHWKVRVMCPERGGSACVGLCDRFLGPGPREVVIKIFLWLDPNCIAQSWVWLTSNLFAGRRCAPGAQVRSSLRV